MKTLTFSMLVASAMGIFLLACGSNPPTSSSQPTSSNLPDLVIVDIILKPKPANYGNQDDVIINTVIRNIGANATQGFIVGCSFSCSGNFTWFSGMKVANGLGNNQEVTLGNDSLLSLSGCSFEAQREFTCAVDSDKLVTELDESNNTATEVLLTGR